MKRKVAMYLRVSTIDQALNGYGLGDQEVQCKKYIELYYPDDEVVTYKDDGYSAKSLLRPEMEHMLEDVKNNKIHTIIAFKLDRISRSVIDTYNLIKTVMKYDCSIVSVVDRIDISSANGRMIVGILSVFSQFEREVISERTLAGLEEMVRNNKYPYGGKNPFGFDKSSDLKLCVNEREKEIINYMADCYIDGYSQKEIRDKVMEQYNVKVRWQDIKKILIRKLNIGIFYYKGNEYSSFVQPILDIEKYNKIIQSASLREIHRGEKFEYSLHRLIYCKCGCITQHVCTVKKKNGIKTIVYRYYYCDKCNKRILQSKLEEQVINKIFIDGVLERIRLKEIVLNQKLSQLETKKNEVFNKYLSDDIDLNTYNYTLMSIEKEKLQLLKQHSLFEIQSKEDYFSFSKQERYDYMHQLISRIYFDFDAKQIIELQYKKK